MQLAEDMGMKVERRQIPEEELSTFEEAGACGNFRGNQSDIPYRRP